MVQGPSTHTLAKDEQDAGFFALLAGEAIGAEEQVPPPECQPDRAPQRYG